MTALSVFLGGAGTVAQSPLADLVRTFAPFDLDGDGRAEVRALEAVGDAGAPGQPLVVGG